MILSRILDEIVFFVEMKTNNKHTKNTAASRARQGLNKWKRQQFTSAYDVNTEINQPVGYINHRNSSPLQLLYIIRNENQKFIIIYRY
jgi:hypothetical protein